MKSGYLLSLAAALGCASALPQAPSPFDPNAYKKKFVTCNAVERSGETAKPIEIKLAYLDINPTAKKTLLLVHGWPSLWTTYREQILAFGKEYRLILPENRGFGDSEHPKDLQKSNSMPDVSRSHCSEIV
jgi:soluble epoxide hydrolase / lipid-phosphate phosphatase